MASPFQSGYDHRNDSAMDLRLQTNSPFRFSNTHTHSSAIVANPATGHSQWPNSPSPGLNMRMGSRGISAGSSEMPGPWSEVNRRIDHASSSSHWKFDRPAPAPTFDDSDPRDYRQRTLEDNLATIQSKLALPIPDESTANLCSSPKSLPVSRIAASDVASSSAIPTSNCSETTLLRHPLGNPKTIYCGLCSTSFNGKWRRGNLNRHVKLKHSGKGGMYDCIADGCYKSFARSDARIKHVRHHHAKLLSSPLLRRHGHEKEPSTPKTASTYHPDSLSGSWTAQDSGTGFTISPMRRNEPLQSQIPESDIRLRSQDSSSAKAGVKRTSTTDTHGSSASSLELTVGQWLPPSSACEAPTVFGAQQQLHRDFTVEELPLAARIVFGSLYKKLDADNYSRFCDSYFDRWERLLNYLRQQQSDIYTLYAQVVKDLHAVVDAIDAGAVDLMTFGLTYHTSRPHASQQGSSHGLGELSQGFGGIGAGLPSGRSSKPDGRKASESTGGGNDARVAKKSKVKKHNEKGVNCPEFKHWSMRGRNSSIPRPQCNGCRETVMSQVRNHINRSSHGNFIVRQCQTCKTDFVTQRAYDEHVAAHSCDHEHQPRNNIVLAWARLYIMMYPNVTQIPNPYCGESSWLNNSIVAQCRSWLRSIMPSPFLGSRQGHNAPPRPVPATIPVHTPDYNAAMIFALQTAVAPSSIRDSDPNATTLEQSVSRLAGLSPHTPAVRDQYIQRLRGISSQYFHVVADAPNYLQHEELANLASEADAVIRQIRVYLERQRHQNQDQTQSQPYQTPRNPLSSRGDWSTQPSTQSRHTDSSLAPGSYATRPSSVYDSADLGHRNPLLPNNYQQSPVPAQVLFDRSRIQTNWSPAQQASQYQQVPPYQQASPHRLLSPYHQVSSYQQPAPYQHAGSPHQYPISAQISFQQARPVYQPPWNSPQSTIDWSQDMPVYWPDGTVDPSVLSSQDDENGAVNDTVVRRLFPPR